MGSKIKDGQDRKRKRECEDAAAIRAVEEAERAALEQLLEQCAQLGNYAGLAQWVADRRHIPEDMQPKVDLFTTI